MTMNVAPIPAFLSLKDLVKLGNFGPQNWWTTYIEFDDRVRQGEEISEQFVDFCEVSHSPHEIQIGNLGVHTTLIFFDLLLLDQKGFAFLATSVHCTV
jgi:hypothetical protein